MSGLSTSAGIGRVRGKNALVSGGASGIGIATALLLEREGVRVFAAVLAWSAFGHVCKTSVAEHQ